MKAPLLGLAIAVLAAGFVACAGIVGADFDDEYPSDYVTPPYDAAAFADTGVTLPPIVPDGGACPEGLIDCAGNCVDERSDPAHCGACDTVCQNDPHGPGVCITSLCSLACMNGYIRCAAGCCQNAQTQDAGPHTPPPDAGVHDSGPVEVPDSSPEHPDSGPADPGIACAASYCSVAAQAFCCGGGNGQDDGGDVCDTNAADGCPYEFFCTDTFQCEGSDICCYDDTAGITTSECQTSCDPGQLQFCNPLVSGECLNGTDCTGQFTGTGAQTTYSFCQ